MLKRFLKSVGFKFVCHQSNVTSFVGVKPKLKKKKGKKRTGKSDEFVIQLTK